MTDSCHSDHQTCIIAAKGYNPVVALVAHIAYILGVSSAEIAETLPVYR
jgi:hypothetical protein